MSAHHHNFFCETCLVTLHPFWENPAQEHRPHTALPQVSGVSQGLAVATAGSLPLWPFWESPPLTLPPLCQVLSSVSVSLTKPKSPSHVWGCIWTHLGVAMLGYAGLTPMRTCPVQMWWDMAEMGPGLEVGWERDGDGWDSLRSGSGWTPVSFHL